jgi:hypothetical protein
MSDQHAAFVAASAQLKLSYIQQQPVHSKVKQLIRDHEIKLFLELLQGAFCHHHCATAASPDAPQPCFEPVKGWDGLLYSGLVGGTACIAPCACSS